MSNCICRIFEDNTWLIILAVICIVCCCNN